MKANDVPLGLKISGEKKMRARVFGAF